MPHYLAAREGNAQSRNTLSLCQKMGAKPQKALGVPFPLQCGQFLQGWDRSFQVLRQTDLEVDLEQTQYYCMEWPDIYLFFGS